MLCLSIFIGNQNVLHFHIVVLVSTECFEASKNMQTTSCHPFPSKGKYLTQKQTFKPHLGINKMCYRVTNNNISYLLKVTIFWKMGYQIFFFCDSNLNCSVCATWKAKSPLILCSRIPHFILNINHFSFLLLGVNFRSFVQCSLADWNLNHNFVTSDL